MLIVEQTFNTAFCLSVSCYASLSVSYESAGDLMAVLQVAHWRADLERSLWRFSQLLQTPLSMACEGVELLDGLAAGCSLWSRP